MKFTFFVGLILFTMEITLLYNFNKNTNPNDWRIIDDVVMGGNSSGNFKIDNEGNGVFFGAVSLENNGGFSSVRHQLKKTDIQSYNKVKIRLKGDGKTYQFRIKESSDTYYSYITSFKTSGDWETITLNLKDFYPSFRGRNLNLPNFSGEYIQEMVFLIGNKKNESFQLILDDISLEK